jgi:hypothetical protein
VDVASACEYVCGWHGMSERGIGGGVLGLLRCDLFTIGRGNKREQGGRVSTNSREGEMDRWDGA